MEPNPDAPSSEGIRTRDLLAFHCKCLNIHILRKETNTGFIGEEGDHLRNEIPGECGK